jgi:hypothetical protein
MNSKAWQFAILVLYLAAVGCAGKEEGRAQTDGGTRDPGSVKASVEEAPALTTKDLGKIVDLFVAEANRLPRAEFDPAALAARVGRDPQKLQDWVRDHTYWAPYRGLSRGPKGVMLDRVGNSLDRAVLLGELLRRSGFTVRLAHAQLSEARARELLANVRPIPAQRRNFVAPGAMPAERQRAIAALVPNYDKLTQELIAGSKRVESEAEGLVRSQTETLLAATRPAASPRPDNELAAAVAAISDHWWIERFDAGKWVAMDVLLPDARSGEAIAAAAAVSEWPANQAWPSIPDTQWQSVQMRVVVERYEAGDTKESTVLETEFQPAKLIDQPVGLGHMPLPWRNGISATENLDTFREAALAVRAWLPFLQVGNELISQLAFTNQGDAESAPGVLASISDTSGAEQAGSIASALGGFGGDEAGPAATAEWLDYEIRVPGSRPEKLRRPVFDLLGPARRASKVADFNGTADLPKLQRFEALYSNTSILFQVCDITDEFIASLLVDGVVAVQSDLDALTRESDNVKAREQAEKLMLRLSRWGPLPNLALWRSTLTGEPRDTFPDRPNVLNFRATRLISQVEKPVVRHSIDIASNSIGTRQGADRDLFEIRVRQGVADTVAEMLAIGGSLHMSENAASIFSRLASEGSRGLLIAARDLDAAKALPWPEDELARIAADVDAGYMTLVPRQAVVVNGEQHVGWWRVDPNSGETIGVMDSGMHAATAERAKLQAMVDELEAFLAGNPVQPLNAAPGSSAHAAWQAQNGSLCILHSALKAVLKLAATEALGVVVAPIAPLPLGCFPI